VFGEQGNGGCTGLYGRSKAGLRDKVSRLYARPDNDGILGRRPGWL
jgi:hypothetical protein